MVAADGAAVAVAGLGDAEKLGAPEPAAEAALLQARLDSFQAQPARLGEHGPGGGRKG
ncbi:hypothetical protein STVIR_6712 [Streptomyces viridochromogenes Tue57]|uniref:Uncharacterized protein n=1 Tax=Streptomyces viridochromogenes Tue57 TaxID=1160705 RepID=L8P7C9_STRVR|nr:hypothetical protein STVIR_6712 [Streptomyces viridochromogenes Tue57]